MTEQAQQATASFAVPSVVSPAVHRPPSSKIRVLFVLEGLYGRGAERVTLGLISRLDRQHFEPSIWILRSEDALKSELPPGVPVTVALGPGQRIRHAVTQVPTTLLAAARGADVIVGAVELMPTYFAGLASLLTRTPALAWVRNDLSHTFSEQPAWHRVLSRLIYTRLPRLVFVSQGTRETLARLQPLRSERLSVVYNPIDLERVRAYKDHPLPDWAAFMRTRPTVLGLGRLTAQKGFDTLIRAHAHLLRQGVAHDLVIAGEGEERSALERLIEELGVQDSVHLPGYLPNPYPLLGHASVFALSSRYEGLGGVIVEAMACGTPVVATDCPSGPGELLEGGWNGLLVPVDDAIALAGALGRMLTQPAVRHHFTVLGLRRAEAFAPAQSVPQWEAVLRDVARGGVSGGIAKTVGDNSEFVPRTLSQQ
ncbi:glycosyltransferase [Deinococcus sp. QL22]|uniref:glycosyltransferase n=1 Tax=Deinococcus sp. QL22 TaxID=2939437 RepID=UPI0020182D10|nr:glycosyltransferase [Deinococcus sp. QL22]UQN09749.1 glycosyltransferase [Deinococcus sp. QL22]